MNVVNSRTFRSGNSVALRLPRTLGVAADVEMRIEKDGDALIVRPARDPAEGRARLARMIAALDALPAPGEIGPREPIDIPERPGLA